MVTGVVLQHPPTRQAPSSHHLLTYETKSLSVTPVFCCNKKNLISVSRDSRNISIKSLINYLHSIFGLSKISTCYMKYLSTVIKQKVHILVNHNKVDKQLKVRSRSRTEDIRSEVIKRLKV